MSSVSMCGVVKYFGDFCANDHINFTLENGEIHALLGENGAGKTTLMNILYGIYAADEGRIEVDGKVVEISSPRVAMAHGIGMVHQHFMLVPNFTVAQNMVLGVKDHLWLNIKKVEAELRLLSQRYGLKIDPCAKVSTLSVGEQERVEIMKALYRKADVLILDEPTAVLTPQETVELFEVLNNLTKQGVSIIIITHKLEEIMAVSHRVTVLRAGQMVATVNTAETTKEELAQMMVGREVVLTVERTKVEPGEVVLQLKQVTHSANGIQKLRGVSLEVRAGEVVGIAGVDGNGQRELASVIAGMAPVSGGEISFGGRRIEKASVDAIMKQGLSYVPEDRLKEGLIGEFSIEDNFITKTLNKHTKFGLLQKKEVRSHAEQMIRAFDVRAKGPTQQAKLLSGGNQQKIIIAREFERSPKLLLVAQPTRGLDVGAIEYVWKAVMDAKKQGVAVLMISTELEEIFALSDRILVLYEGQIIGQPMTPETADINQMGLLMAGVGKERGAANVQA